MKTLFTNQYVDAISNISAVSEIRTNFSSGSYLAIVCAQQLASAKCPVKMATYKHVILKYTLPESQS